MRWRGFRPANGWRGLLGEIAIIVAGVLIALGAQQAVDNWRWDRDVAAGREALREDYKAIVTNARERKELDGCIRARLGELAGMLDRDPDHTPGLQRFGSPPERPWASRSWDSLVATEVSTHMSRDEMLSHANIAATARTAEEKVVEEMRAWAHLYSLTGARRPLASGEAAAIRQSLALAMYRLNLVRLTAPQLEREIMQTKLLTKADLAEIDENVARLRTGPNWQGNCAPVTRAAGGGVEAPYDPAIQTDPLWQQRAAAQAQTRARAASRP
ncbi:hypothetical protein [Sphingomonas mesophila]|uniref:hypothetical protein n=1 Tax=Sphingomonas mesophila TaxID=2303576 RepID=UPI000E56F042|nr:hypothetical protein [Sphingomonas mesophila]